MIIAAVCGGSMVVMEISLSLSSPPAVDCYVRTRIIPGIYHDVVSCMPGTSIYHTFECVMLSYTSSSPLRRGSSYDIN